MLGVMLFCAFITEIIGLHSLFGAFIAGIIMPRSLELRTLMIHKTEALTIGLLLPIFFVSTGLRTDIHSLATGTQWLWCVIIIIAAVAGKLGGCTVAARITGESWRDSIAIGALMNTRGLMQLVVLTIGYENGLITLPLFTMMVVMAVVTTMMTSPILRHTKASWTAVFAKTGDA